MNSPEMPACPHTTCDHPQRLEYCKIEAKDPGGDAGVCIDMIEELLYIRGDFERGIRYTSDGEVRYIARDFEYLHSDERIWAWPLLETRVSIQHEHNVRMNSHSYTVRIGWRSHQNGASEDFYETIYTLEQWPGLVHATIDEYEITTDQLDTHETPQHRSRPIVRYDYATLFDSLSILDNMRIGEERDRAV